MSILQLLWESLDYDREQDCFFEEDEETPPSVEDVLAVDNIELPDPEIFHKTNAPKRVGIGYKLFKKTKKGLMPPMVSNRGGLPTPVGEWIEAEEGEAAPRSKTGRRKVKSAKGGSLSYRPGWHLGVLPYALQFNKDNPITGLENSLFPDNLVWYKVYYAADNDYQWEAMKGGFTPKDGESYDDGKVPGFNNALAGLQRLPINGYYVYRTNPNTDTDPWIITGKMYVAEELTKEEVDRIVKGVGRAAQEVWSKEHNKRKRDEKNGLVSPQPRWRAEKSEEEKLSAKKKRSEEESRAFVKKQYGNLLDPNGHIVDHYRNDPAFVWNQIKKRERGEI